MLEDAAYLTAPPYLICIHHPHNSYTSHQHRLITVLLMQFVLSASMLNLDSSLQSENAIVCPHVSTRTKPQTD